MKVAVLYVLLHPRLDSLPQMSSNGLASEHNLSVSCETARN